MDGGINVNQESSRSSASKLFLPEQETDSKDLFILSDRPGEILEVDPPVHMCINGYELLSKLLRNPLTNRQDISKRQREIGRLTGLDDDKLMGILQRNNIIKRIFGVPFSEEMSMDNFLRYLREMQFTLSEERNEIESIFIGTTFHQIKEVGDIIPEQIRAIKSVGGEFFSGFAKELDEAKGKITNFPIAKVFELLSKIKRAGEMKNKFWRSRHKERIKEVQRRLYDDLRKVYTEFMGDIANFSEVYRVLDALLILSIWIRRGYLHTSTFSIQEEHGNTIKDARHLLSGDVEAFSQHIPNNLRKLPCGRDRRAFDWEQREHGKKRLMRKEIDEGGTIVQTTGVVGGHFLFIGF